MGEVDAQAEHHQGAASMIHSQEAGPVVAPSAAVGLRVWLQRAPWRERGFWLRYSTFYAVIALIKYRESRQP